MFKRYYSNIFLYIFSPAIILAALFFCYSDTFSYPFHFDDQIAIKDNDTIKDLGDIRKIWSFNPVRFLTFLSLAVNYHFSGLDVFSYHVFNFIIHFITALLVFWFARIIVSTKPTGLYLSGTGEAPVGIPLLYPLAVSLLFAVHPLQTEAVTYIWQRNTSLAAMFYILSISLYLKSSLIAGENKNGTKPLSALLFSGSVAAAIAASLTKQFAVTLPIAIFLIEWFFISGSLSRMREKALRLAAFLPVMMIIPILTAIGKNQEINHIGERSKNVLSHYEYLLTQFNVIVTYLRLLVFPTNQNLDYNYPVARSFGDSFISFAGLILIAGAAVWLFNKNRIASFGIFFFFLALSVESSIFPLEDLAFEHRVYLPSVGFFIALTSLIFLIAQKISLKNSVKILSVLLAATVIILALAAKTRNYVWKDGVALWEDVVLKSPDKARGQLNLGVEYIRRGRFKKARALFERALTLEPGYSSAYYNLGRTYELEDDYKKAMEIYKAGLKASPAAPKIHYALGNLFMRDKMYQQAANQYKIGLITENGENVEALLTFGTALMLSGQFNKSIKAHQLVLKTKPDNALALNNLGALYLHKGDKEKAAFYLKKAREYGYNVTVPGF